MLQSVSSVLLVPPLRLAWVLAMLWWATGLKQPAVLAVAPPVETVLGIGSAHHAPPEPVALIEQVARNREAVAPALPESGAGLPVVLALVPTGHILWPTKWVGAQLPLAVRACAVPDLFRLRLLVAALAPNAP